MGIRTLFLLSAAAAVGGCSLPDVDGDGIPAADDCNDLDPDQGRPGLLFIDGDGDGWGSTETDIGCPGNSWLVDNDLDCDDRDPDLRPDAEELGCDGIDNDCDPDTADGPAVTLSGTWSSVQEALDNAEHHEIVQLCASTIHESVVVRAPVTLRGAGAGKTVLDGTGLDTSVVEVRASLTLADLTITGGVGTVDPETGLRRGGGVLVADGDRFSIERSVVAENSADDGGGIALLQDIPSTIWDSMIVANQAVRGGGLFASGTRDLGVHFSAITDNTADDGGGLWVSDWISLEEVEVSGNQAITGGGISLSGFGPVLFSYGTGGLRDNHAVRGGGLYGWGDVEGLRIEHNTADEGGGAYLDGLTLLDEVEILDNQAWLGDGGGVLSRGHLEMWGSTVADNSTVGDGGGLQVQGTGDLSLIDVRLTDNEAARGAALSVADRSCTSCLLFQSELQGNTATASGGAIHAGCGDYHLLVQDTTIVDNTAPSGAAVHVDDAAVSLVGAEVLTHTSTDPSGAAVWVSWSGCQPVSELAADAVVFGANTPADLAVGAHSVATAPSTFQCRTDAEGDAIDPDL